MNKIDKELLRNLIGSGKTEGAIKELLTVTAKVDEATHSQVTNLQSQYSKLKSEEISGILSVGESNIGLAKINRSLLSVISLLPEEYPDEPKKTTQKIVEEGSEVKSSKTPSNVQSGNSQPLGPVNYMLLSLLLIFIAAMMYLLFSEMFEGKSDNINNIGNGIIITILALSVAVAMFGAMRSEASVQSKFLKLGGPIVVFLLVLIGYCGLPIDGDISNIPCTPPKKPDTLRCYHITTLDTIKCEWEIKGKEPKKPDSMKNLKDCQKAIFDDNICEWRKEITPISVNDDCDLTTDSFDPINCKVINSSNCRKGTIFNKSTCKCDEKIIYDCTDDKATNYNPKANKDDDSCMYKSTVIYGCTDDKATNYNPKANKDNGSCKYKSTVTYGCTNDKATNYNPKANKDDGSCQYKPTIIYGCTDDKATNYNPKANKDDSSCQYKSTVTFSVKCKDYEIDNLIIINSDNMIINPRIEGKESRIVTIYTLTEGDYSIELITKHPQNPICRISVNQNLKELIVSANNKSCNEKLTNF